jgi:hypothetical protein
VRSHRQQVLLYHLSFCSSSISKKQFWTEVPEGLENVFFEVKKNLSAHIQDPVRVGFSHDSSEKHEAPRRDNENVYR